MCNSLNWHAYRLIIRELHIYVNEVTRTQIGGQTTICIGKWSDTRTEGGQITIFYVSEVQYVILSNLWYQHDIYICWYKIMYRLTARYQHVFIYAGTYKIMYRLTDIYQRDVFVYICTYKIMYRLTTRYQHDVFVDICTYKIMYRLTARYQHDVFVYICTYTIMYILTAIYQHDVFVYICTHTVMYLTPNQIK